MVADHRVTCIEAYWLESKLEIDEDGEPATVDRSVVESVEGTTFSWEYYCRCGEEFPHVDAARKHLREVGEIPDSVPMFDTCEFSNDVEDAVSVDVTPRQAAYLANVLAEAESPRCVDAVMLFELFEDVACATSPE
ncbi:hypothetical protein [Salinibaculum rarum]|uniref:hypothetical protein n=1 Tax=Salinibaculum rarum TaxID=3058903 RepID=UPI00265DE5BF|nr:hypothetical protein [Salinibaculum sp. KK48]